MNTSQFLHFSSKANQLRALNLRSCIVYGRSIGVHHTPYFMGIASVDILITVHQWGICKHFLLLKKRYFFSLILLFNFFPGRIIEDLQYFFALSTRTIY
jgi:hypothetical protein